MAITITEILGTDSISGSRLTINANFLLLEKNQFHTTPAGPPSPPPLPPVSGVIHFCDGSLAYFNISYNDSAYHQYQLNCLIY